MGNIKIREVLGDGFEILVKNPVLLVLGLFANIPLILVQRKMLGWIIYFLISPYFIGLIVRFIYESIEKKPSWKELSNFVLSKYILLLIVHTILCAITCIGLALLIIPGLFLSVKLILSDYGILLENDGVVSALKRSWEITKGNWWNLFALVLICYLPAIIFSFFESLFPWAIYASFSFLISIFVFVWFQSTITLAYLRLRKIK